jgi:UDP-GlcNAc:undecaprenyl-phosphate GlcNAc-1-phosphate transferase
MVFYLKVFLLSLFLSLLLVPIIRYISIKLNNVDRPTDIKTHKGVVPLSGGIAVFVAFSVSLFIVRFSTSFPTGTLRDIRYILLGSFLILLIGIIDDFKKPKGISAGIKFFLEIIIAIFMISRGFSINFIKPDHFALVLSVIWIVGITNSFNIIDIMDGLSSSQIFIAAISFLIISIPTEAIYVNVLSSSIAGAILGFIPYNMSNRYKIFLGDSGSLFAGFLISIISLGVGYSDKNPLAVYVPILILSVPIFDTIYVSIMRIKSGISPFKGTKDHFALRLESMGFERKKIVLLTFIFSSIVSMISFLITRVSFKVSIFLYMCIFTFFVFVAKIVSKVKIS